jgi:hypothetical protein
MAKTSVQFALAGDLKIGQYPHIPIRWMLQGALQSTLGITAADNDEIRELGGSMPKGWTPSGNADAMGSLFVKAAAVGLCWPDSIECPSLRDCGHDVIEYGEGVYDSLIRIYAPMGKAAQLQRGIGKIGTKLITDMNADAGKIFGSEVKAEKDFIKAPKVASING